MLVTLARFYFNKDLNYTETTISILTDSFKDHNLSRNLRINIAKELSDVEAPGFSIEDVFISMITSNEFYYYSFYSVILKMLLMINNHNQILHKLSTALISGDINNLIKLRIANIIVLINPDDMDAIETIKKILTTKDDFIECVNLQMVAERNELDSTDLGNVLQILFKKNQKKRVRNMAYSVLASAINNSERKTVFEIVVYCKRFLDCKISNRILFQCAQILTYSEFYAAWHIPMPN